MIRTAVICGVALALGPLGSHGKRADLGWLVYSAVALGILKLFLEDLRFGNAASLAVSLFFYFYGLILILLPRLTKSSCDFLRGSDSRLHSSADLRQIIRGLGDQDEPLLCPLSVSSTAFLISYYAERGPPRGELSGLPA
jgi:hypothetical protein